MPLYGSAAYWEEHYQVDEDATYDWLISFSELRSVLVEYGGCTGLGYRSRLKTLIVGCGKSALAEEMYDAGWKTIDAIDISRTVIEHMKTRSDGLGTKVLQNRRGNNQMVDDYNAVDDFSARQSIRGRRGLKYHVMDACKLKKEWTESFDFIIDKSTLDALLCTRSESILTVDNYLKNIYNCLKHGGTFLTVSLGPPKRRESKFKRKGLKWQVKVLEIPKPDMEEFNVRDEDERYIYVYVLRKDERTDFKVATTKDIENDENDDIPLYDPDKEINVYKYGKLPGEVLQARRRTFLALKRRLLPCNPPPNPKELRRQLLVALKKRLLPIDS